MHNERVTLLWHTKVGVQHFVFYMFTHVQHITVFARLFWLSEEPCCFLSRALFLDYWALTVARIQESRLRAKQPC